MDLKANQRRKMDGALAETLASVEEDAPIRVLLQLEFEPGAKAERLDPAGFESRAAYRAAANEQRQEALAEGTSETRDELKRIGVRVHGGKLGRTVVVEGTARQVAASTALAGVKHAVLDREVDVTRPVRTAERVVDEILALGVVDRKVARTLVEAGIDDVETLAGLSSPQRRRLSERVGMAIETVRQLVAAAVKVRCSK